MTRTLGGPDTPELYGNGGLCRLNSPLDDGDGYVTEVRPAVLSIAA
jgi:hypothetical protein